MSLSHTALAYLVGHDHCADILALMTPTQLIIAYLRASGYTDASIGRALDLPPTTVTRAMNALAEQIAKEIPELRVTLAGRARCPSLTPENRPETFNEPPPPTPEGLSAHQIAEHLYVAPATIRLWCRQGRFPNAVKSGPHWHIPEADLDHVAQSSSDGTRWATGAETLSVAQVAQRLGLSSRTVTVWCAHGRFPGAYKDGPGLSAPWRIPESALCHHTP